MMIIINIVVVVVVAATIIVVMTKSKNVLHSVLHARGKDPGPVHIAAS